MPEQRRKFSPQFKAEAVQMVLETGKPIAEVARDLGCSDQTLRNWVAQAAIDAGEREGLTSDERAELARLRRENRLLREEREILRKAAAFFAQETMSGGSR
ncbi:MAG TPA: transposase [Candidatus Limnocylindria bacterium]|nr:transposase [Candidatus Limnocylindria bacterium]